MWHDPEPACHKYEYTSVTVNANLPACTVLNLQTHVQVPYMMPVA